MNDELDVAALSQRYGPMVLRRCRQLLHADDEALDAAQDVFVRLIERRHRLDGRYPSSLRYTMATGNISRATLGGHVGGGVDAHVARSFSLGLSVGYNAMVNFSRPVGLRDNFNGVQVALGVGRLFGKGN